MALIWCCLALIAAAYVSGMAYWQSRQQTYYRFESLLVPRAIDVFIFFWLIWVTSAFGSFLNVVAWRMPRGESVGGRSYCPRCQSQLLARDNFPVLGWIALAGRCRTCRLPISPRYPIVEAAVGVSLTLIGLAELYRWNLPNDLVIGNRGPLWMPSMNQSVFVVMFYHLVVVAVGWAYGLIRYDRHRLPAKLIAVGLAMTVLPILIAPSLMIVSWRLESHGPLIDSIGPAASVAKMHLDALTRVITALAAAVVFGRSLTRGFCPTADLKLDPLSDGTRRLVDLIIVISIPAVLVGWQSLPAVLLLASLLAIISKRCLPNSDSLGRFSIVMPIATAIQIVLWRYAVSAWWWPSEGSDPWVFLIASAAACMIPLWLNEASDQNGRFDFGLNPADPTGEEATAGLRNPGSVAEPADAKRDDAKRDDARAAVDDRGVDALAPGNFAADGASRDADEDDFDPTPASGR